MVRPFERRLVRVPCLGRAIAMKEAARSGRSDDRAEVAPSRATVMAFVPALILSACPAPRTEPRDAAVVAALADASAEAVDATTVPAAPRLHEATRLEAEVAAKHLERWVHDGATETKNAWHLAHGLVAFGPGLLAANNKPAIDVMVSDYVEEKKDRRGRVRLVFPELGKDGVPISPHRDLIVKTLEEVGAPSDRIFKLKSGRKVTVADLVRDAQETFTFPTTDDGWRNYAWSAHALFLAGEKTGKVETSSGTVTMKELAEKTLSRLEEEQRFLEELMAANAPERLDKRRQGIYAHHCGGLHLVEAAVLGAAISEDPALIARARRQLDIVLFRWEAERRIYEDTLREQPKYKWLLLVQELKFYGHVLEALALARERGVLPKGEAIDKRVRMVAGDLTDAVDALAPAYERQDMIGQIAAQVRYDLVGDGCHAIRGLRRGLVAFFAP